jgi:shikimate dehydrogenase
MIHNLAFEALGLQGEYRLYPLPTFPDGIKGLELLLGNMRQGQIQGLNVTIPHKQNVIDYLDDLTPIARTIGAVNTILWDQDQLIGDNTDAEGFWVDVAGFMKNNPEILGSQALILGAGGAARAVAFALLVHDWRVWVAARRFEQAQTLVRDLHKGESNLMKTGPETSSNRPETWTDRLFATSISELLDVQSAIRNIRLIINATPVGKFPDIEDTPWPSALSFPDNIYAYDLVYNPPETRFLQQARQTGCIVRSGKGMLVEQALLSFELWTGIIPPREIILRSMNMV